MQIIINDTAITLPATAGEVTLGQRIAFYQQYGKLLDDMLASVLEMEEEAQEFEFGQWQMERMYCVFSFFSGIAVEVLRASDIQDELTTIYFSFLQHVFDDVASERTAFAWNGDEWALPPSTLKQGSDMTFGEFIDAKQSVQNLASEGGSKAGFLLPLSAIFLKKKMSNTLKIFFSKKATVLN